MPNLQYTEPSGKVIVPGTASQEKPLNILYVHPEPKLDTGGWVKKIRRRLSDSPRKGTRQIDSVTRGKGAPQQCGRRESVQVTV